jgi:hypothetical protein
MKVFLSSTAVDLVAHRQPTAARLLALPPGGGRPGGVDEALRAAGVAAWPKALAQARESLSRLGPRRARALPLWLYELERGLKGAASRGPRASLALVGKGHSERLPGETGSNNWVVAPSRTSGGRALLANDPHLSLTNPSIWFPVEIDAKELGNLSRRDFVYDVRLLMIPGGQRLSLAVRDEPTNTVSYVQQSVFVSVLPPEAPPAAK